VLCHALNSSSYIPAAGTLPGNFRSPKICFNIISTSQTSFKAAAWRAAASAAADPDAVPIPCGSAVSFTGYRLAGDLQDAAAASFIGSCLPKGLGEFGKACSNR
jgi:hypothetical protein